MKYLVIPTGSSIAMAASSSVGGAEDNDERSESESAMVDVVGRWCEGQGWRPRRKRHVGSTCTCARSFNGILYATEQFTMRFGGNHSASVYNCQ